jgi:DNA-binding HxlR family transcriptional regulator
MPDEIDPLFATDCASRHFFDQVSNKWSVMILTLLCARPQRFNAIKRQLQGITHKALTEALRRMERNGLVARRVISSSPVAVEYSLTPLGNSLKDPFSAVYRWTVDHLPAIEQAQQDYDARPNR